MAMFPTMVDTLIFSRDRPAQLDLLLRSINRYADAYKTVTCLFRPSDYAYSTGYARLMVDHLGMGWMREVDFEAQTRQWLDRAGRAISFLVDDDIFYAPMPRPVWPPMSPRAGDYDYPLSVDGCVYDKEDILPLLDFKFENPSQLESGLHDRRDRYPHAAFATIYPCLIGVPANRVSASSEREHMGVDPAELNQRYLAGERISLDKTLAQLDKPAPHVRLEYQWVA